MQTANNMVVTQFSQSLKCTRQSMPLFTPIKHGWKDIPYFPDYKPHLNISPICSIKKCLQATDMYVFRLDIYYRNGMILNYKFTCMYLKRSFPNLYFNKVATLLNKMGQNQEKINSNYRIS